jgi:hypothetical protein
VEQLEDLITPSMISWNGAAGDNNWTTPGNWNTGQLPGSSDDVVINQSGAVVLYQGGSTTVNSITDNDTLKIESGSLTTNLNVQQYNGTLQVDNGTLSGGTGIAVSGVNGGVGMLNYNGGTLSGTVTVSYSPLNIGSGGTGAASFVLGPGVTLTGNVSAGQTLWVQANNTWQNVTLTDNGNVTNHGTILLETLNNTWSETLNTNNGTLTNAADGTIQAIANSGGGRTITGTLDNQGQISVDTSSLLTIQGTYDADGGNITGPGYVYYATLNILASPSSATTILVGGRGVVLATNNLANTTIWVQGNGTWQQAQMTVDNGVTNHGTILLESVNNTWSDTLALSGTLINAADGTIQATAGSGGDRTITGTLDNQGQISVDTSSLLTIQGTYDADGGNISGPGYAYDATLNILASPSSATTILVGGRGVVLATNNLANTTIWVQGNGTWQQAQMTVDNGVTNHGTILLESVNNTWSDTLALGGTFTNAADGTIQAIANSGGDRTITGTLDNQGQISVDTSSLLTVQNTYDADGGTITGPGYVYNATLNILASPSSATTILVGGRGVVLATNNLANTTIWVQGNNIWQQAILTVNNGLSNDGTILLESINNTWSDTLALGGTFTNAAHGTIQAIANSGGDRTITGTLDNQGQISVDTSSLLTIQGTYDADGGTITGPGYVYNATLNIVASPSSATTILVGGRGVVLATSNLANTTIWVQGNNIWQQAALTVNNGLSNKGTILLESINNTWSDTLTLGGTFTNAAHGTILVSVGAGGGRSITGTLINDGTINVAGGQTLSIGGSNWSNAGTINVSNDTLDLSGLGGSPFTNTSHGVINFDTTSGNAGVSANDTLSNAGTVTVAGTNVLYLENGLTLKNTKSGKLIFTNNSSLASSGGGTLVNAGTVEKTKGTGTSTISPVYGLNNTGTVAVYSGTLDVTATVTQVSGSTLTAGSWAAYGSSTVSATLTIGSAGSITTIGTKAKVTLSGLNSSFTNINGSGGLNSILAGGSFTIQSGQSFTTAGNFSNAGTVTLTSGTLTITGTVAQLAGNSLTGGTWTVNANSNLNFTAASNITALAGAKVTLSGTNSNFAALANLASISKTSSFSLLGDRSFTAVGSFTNSGKLTIDAGSTLTANGSFTQASTASLAISLGGTDSAPTFGQVVSTTGTVTLAGSITGSSSVLPTVGSSFEVLDNEGNAAISGTFTQGTTFTIKKGSTTMTFQISYVGSDSDGSNNVIITRIS